MEICMVLFPIIGSGIIATALDIYFKVNACVLWVLVLLGAGISWMFYSQM